MQYRCYQTYLLSVVCLTCMPLSLQAQQAAQPAKKIDPQTLSQLQKEHSLARDELLAAEARISLLEQKIYRSQLLVELQGKLDNPYQLASIELWLNGSLAYIKEFTQSPREQVFRLFSGYVAPGRYVVELRMRARGPLDTLDDRPGFFAGSGMVVYTKENSISEVTFEAEQQGQTATNTEQQEEFLEGHWEVEIESSYECRATSS